MSKVRQPFRIDHDQVPEPPRTNHYRDLLRWCVVVMDDDDPQIGFAASLLSDSIEIGGLPKKLNNPADVLIDRVTEMHKNGLLHCQTECPERGGQQPTRARTEPERTD